MRCPHCKEKNPPNTPFCQKCDRWILETYFDEPEDKSVITAKRKPQRRSKPFLCGALVLAVIAFFAVLLWPDAPVTPQTTTQPQLATGPATLPATTRPSAQPPIETVPGMTTPPISTKPPAEIQPDIEANQYVYRTDELAVLSTSDHRSQLIVNDRILDVGYVTSSELSMNGSVLAYLTESGELMLMQPQLPVPMHIATGVTDYALSLDGSTLAYMSYDELYRYDTESSFSEHIDTSSYKYLSSLTISEDGQRIAYYAWPSTPSSISNLMCVLVYYWNTYFFEIGSYTREPSELLSICTDGKVWHNYAHTSDPIISRDGTKLLCHDPDSETTRIWSVYSQNSLIIKQNLALTPIYPAQTMAVTRGEAVFFPCDFFHEQFYLGRDAQSNYTVFYLERDGTLTEVATDVVQTWLDPTGMYLYCHFANGKLTCIHAKDLSSTTIHFKAESFAVANDRSTVYFLLEDIIYQKTGDSARAIVAAPNLRIVAACHGMLYYLKGQDLYVYDGAVHENYLVADVSRWFIGGNDRLYVITDDGQYFISCEDGHMEPLKTE